MADKRATLSKELAVISGYDALVVNVLSHMEAISAGCEVKQVLA